MDAPPKLPNARIATVLEMRLCGAEQVMQRAWIRWKAMEARARITKKPFSHGLQVKRL
jgi:hypothetical protein